MAVAPKPIQTHPPQWATIFFSLVLAFSCLLWMPCSPAGASLLHLQGPAPADLGVGDQGLSPCLSPAHCAAQSWPVDNAQEALMGLLPAVLALEGVDLVETNAGYVHATVSSRLFGFVDDLELYADPAQGVIQARSQSRLGDSDLGVNARRLERLHRALLARSSHLGPNAER